MNLFRAFSNFYYKTIYSNPNHPKSPLNPWAFIRVSNERETLRQSLESILGAISRGVIVYHDCNDGSEGIIKEFCKKNTGFICVEYPHKVAQCSTTKQEMQEYKTLSDYYNFVLSLIPQGEWLVKIDADQIYDAKKLKESFSLVKNPKEIVFYFRVNLHCFDGKIYLDREKPLTDHCDHWLIYNEGLFFEDSILKEEGEKIYYWESLKTKLGFEAYCPYYAPLNTWHFPLLKQSRIDLAKIEDHIPLSYAKEIIPKSYFEEKRISEDMLDEKRILGFLQQ